MARGAGNATEADARAADVVERGQTSGESAETPGNLDAKDVKWCTTVPHEEPHALAGRIVKRLGIFGYGLFFAVPLLFAAIVFAIIPLGDPTVSNIDEQWVFLFVSNLLVNAVYCFLYTAAFLASAGVERAFHMKLWPFAGVIAVQLAIFTPVLLLHGVFDYLGVVAFVAFFLSLYVSLYFTYPQFRTELDSFFRRFVLLLAFYIPILVGYLIGYREAGSLLQVLLSVSIAFITFIYRRIMLSQLDYMPLDHAQLLAGFWIQNMSDTVQIFSFPQVDSPGVLAGVWVSNSFSNVAFLFFISNVWIRKVRPRLKNSVLNGIKCNFPLPEVPEPDESYDPDDRGHSPNIRGYRRRQFRFFFFRLLSQAVAMSLYLAISPMLRYGLNKELTPLDSLVSGDGYRNSMIYAAVNLVFIFVVLTWGYGVLRRRHPETFHEIRDLHVHDLHSQTRVGMIIAIITHNLVFATGVILSPYCIFASFRDCVYNPESF